jgi:hypothetical protein
MNDQGKNQYLTEREISEQQLANAMSQRTLDIHRMPLEGDGPSCDLYKASANEQPR